MLGVYEVCPAGGPVDWAEEPHVGLWEVLREPCDDLVKELLLVKKSSLIYYARNNLLSEIFIREHGFFRAGT